MNTLSININTNASSGNSRNNAIMRTVPTQESGDNILGSKETNDDLLNIQSADVLGVQENWTNRNSRNHVGIGDIEKNRASMDYNNALCAFPELNINSNLETSPHLNTNSSQG